MKRPEVAITLKPLWAWAVAHAGKRIENRSWPTRFRGRIYIHAGTGKLAPENQEIFARCLLRAGVASPVDVVSGALVATATLADCVQLAQSRQGAWGLPGSWHFLLEDVEPLARPIPMSGKLGIWRVSALSD